MSADARRKRLRALLAEDAEYEYERFIDVCLVWELPDGSTLYVGGGRFDREEKKYTDDEPEYGRVVRLEPGQVEAARCLIWWLQGRADVLDEPGFAQGVGTGVGLSVCLGIVTAHEGRITVRSEPGHGTCFTVAQVEQVIPLFSFEADQLKALQIMAPRLVDRQNAFRIYGLFTFESGKQQARRILSSR